MAVGLLLAALLTGCGKEEKVLNVYNWGEYIADGSDGSLNIIEAFEDWYEETYGETVRVNYSTFFSNEDLYNKLSMGAVSYDLMIPSDYMVSRMREEDMLLPLNFDNIPNYQYVSEDFHGLYYDPDDAYSIPYAYGMVGIIYDANVVDPAHAGGWDLMWNEAYIEEMGPETMAIMYPQLGSFFELYNQHAYRNLPADQLQRLNTLWEKLKIQ